MEAGLRRSCARRDKRGSPGLWFRHCNPLINTLVTFRSCVCRNIADPRSLTQSRTRLPFLVSTAPSFTLSDMHPRTQYLADAGKIRDPALQPLLQDNSSRTDQEAAAECPASGENRSGSAAPSAPLLSTATSSASPSAPTSAYGLPSGYRAQYAGALSMSAAAGLSCLV